MNIVNLKSTLVSKLVLTLAASWALGGCASTLNGRSAQNQLSYDYGDGWGLTHKVGDMLGFNKCLNAASTQLESCNCYPHEYKRVQCRKLATEGCTGKCMQDLIEDLHNFNTVDSVLRELEARREYQN